MHIHFVCNGNAYRSRLAEAYLKSKKIFGVEVSSSGVIANSPVAQENGPISWFAQRLISNNNLVPFMSMNRKQLQQKYLDNADVIVFMAKDPFDFVKEKYKLGSIKVEIWQIPDLGDMGFKGKPKTVSEDIKRMKATETTFRQIRKKVDELVGKIKK